MEDILDNYNGFKTIVGKHVTEIYKMISEYIESEDDIEISIEDGELKLEVTVSTEDDPYAKRITWRFEGLKTKDIYTDGFNAIELINIIEKINKYVNEIERS